MQLSEWARSHYDRVKDDPEFLAARLMIEINEHLYIRMEELGLSQRDLAKRINRSQPFVWKLLNHGTNMTLKTLVTLAHALELKVETPKFVPNEEYDEYNIQEVKNEIKLKFTRQTDDRDFKNEDFELKSDLNQEDWEDVSITDAA